MSGRISKAGWERLEKAFDAIVAKTPPVSAETAALLRDYYRRKERQRAEGSRP